ncbi:MAG TPA: transglycosylase domain-containing protein, partial [Hyphomicrobium sp.]|nr:transglycosylase domain-containing protein [Hyphomicrobium sp.]
MDRQDETSGLSAAPSAMQSETGPIAQASQHNSAVRREPPRPLTARAFHTDVAGTAREAAPATKSQSAPEPLSAEAAFSAIEAEASSRSLSAVDGTIAVTLPEIKPHKPIDISELVLPLPAAAPTTDDLGHMIPQRMFEPRFETPTPQPTLVQLEIDTGMRPETWRGKQGVAPPVATEPLLQRTRSVWAIFKRGIKLLVWVAIGWLALALALIVAYRFVNPPASMLMLQHWLTGQPVVHQWVPFNEISPNVVRAVLLSEDGRFCQHSGVDLEAIEEAIENSDGRSRGGSTISMQVV